MGPPFFVHVRLELKGAVADAELPRTAPDVASTDTVVAFSSVREGALL